MLNCSPIMDPRIQFYSSSKLQDKKVYLVLVFSFYTKSLCMQCSDFFPDQHGGFLLGPKHGQLTCFVQISFFLYISCSQLLIKNQLFQWYFICFISSITVLFSNLYEILSYPTQWAMEFNGASLKPEASLIVPGFIIFGYGSSCNSLFF